MKGLLRRVAFALVPLAAVAGSAQGAHVDYYIVGQFVIPTGGSGPNPTPTTLDGTYTYGTSIVTLDNGGGPDTDTKSVLTIDTDPSLPGSSTLTFQFGTNGLAPEPLDPLLHREGFVNGAVIGEAGYFQAVSTSLSNVDAFVGIGFNLTLYQVDPVASPNTGTVFGTISGSLQKVDGVTGSTLALVLNPGSGFSIPDPSGITYSFDAPAQKVSPVISISGGKNNPINMYITNNTIPGGGDVPLPAVAPAAFLLMGGLGLRRNRKSVSAN